MPAKRSRKSGRVARKSSKLSMRRSTKSTRRSVRRKRTRGKLSGGSRGDARTPSPNPRGDPNKLTLHELALQARGDPDPTIAEKIREMMPNLTAAAFAAAVAYLTWLSHQ